MCRVCSLPTLHLVHSRPSEGGGSQPWQPARRKPSEALVLAASLASHLAACRSPHRTASLVRKPSCACGGVRCRARTFTQGVSACLQVSHAGTTQPGRHVVQRQVGELLCPSCGRRKAGDASKGREEVAQPLCAFAAVAQPCVELQLALRARVVGWQRLEKHATLAEQGAVCRVGRVARRDVLVHRGVEDGDARSGCQHAPGRCCGWNALRRRLSGCRQGREPLASLRPRGRLTRLAWDRERSAIKT